MKLNRDQLLQHNYRVFLQKSNQLAPRQVKFPESVDTDTGTVEMWVIPLEDTEVLTSAKSELTNKPPEIDGFAVLKTEQGKVFILDNTDHIIAKGSPVNEELC